MTAYLIRRLVQMVFVLLLSAIFTYALFVFAPGGPLTGLQQTQRRITAEDKARIRAKFELDLYWPVSFSRWLIGFPNGPIVIGGQEWFATLPMGCYMPAEYVAEGAQSGCADYVYLAEIPQLHPAATSSKGILRGDFGKSTVVRVGAPVINEITSRLPATLELGLLSLFFSLLIGVPIGIYSAVKQYSRFDYFFTTLAFIGTSMPSFFFALILILLFSVMPNFWQDTLPWLPKLPPGMREAVRPYNVATWLPRVEDGTAIDRFLHLIMPLTVLTVINIAGWSRFVRSAMLEVLRQDYVRTARAKGLVERIVIMKHALRNALIPFVTIFVLTLPGLFGGAIITETIFSWPGMGRLFIDALNRSDWPVSLALFFISAVLTVVALLVGDILYTIVDPRIKFS